MRWVVRSILLDLVINKKEEPDYELLDVIVENIESYYFSEFLDEFSETRIKTMFRVSIEEYLITVGSCLGVWNRLHSVKKLFMIGDVDRYKDAKPLILEIPNG